MPTNFCHRKLISLLSSQDKQLSRLYTRKAQELAAILKKHKLKSKSNVWQGNAALEKQIDKVLTGMDDEFRNYLATSMVTGQNMANDCLDLQVSKYIKGMDLNEPDKARLFYRNSTALDAWIDYRKKGFKLSSRVWKLTEQTKEQLEFFIKEGLSEGRSANELARDVKQYLVEPDKRFRRIKDENGKLQLSQPAKLYKPGRGVYRSSFKNALRLTRNETNIAYRDSDFQRVQTLDFVKGIRINLSNSHPRYDICDELVGLYPKEFRFVGFHPQCLCFTTTVLMNEDEFVKYVNSGKRTTKNITTIPKRAENYLNDKSDQIKGWSSKPYFIEDNFKNTKFGFALKKSIFK